MASCLSPQQQPCQAPLCSPLPPPLHTLKAQQCFPSQCTSPEEQRGLSYTEEGERGYVHAVFFLLLQRPAEPSCGAGGGVAFGDACGGLTALIKVRSVGNRQKLGSSILSPGCENSGLGGCFCSWVGRDAWDAAGCRAPPPALRRVHTWACSPAGGRRVLGTHARDQL